jgi:succinoglycan biosynthesis transport protein ExoP
MDTQPIRQAVERARGPLSEPISLSEFADQINGFVRRQYPIFVLFITSALVMGILYLLTTPAQYTAHAMLVIDTKKLRVLQEQQAPSADLPLDTAQVETQVEILKSDNVSVAVIRDQRLLEDPEFTANGGGLLGATFGYVSKTFSSPEPRTEKSTLRSALNIFKSRRKVTRVAHTYVLDIAYTSLRPARSATIANAIADAYVTDQLEAKYQATKRAGGWLQARIKELRAQASEADIAVLDYKEKNKIVDIGGDGVGGKVVPRLLGEQALAEVNSQVVTARNATAEAKAKLDRIQEVMKQDLPDAAVTDSLQNAIITRLRNQVLDLSARESIWSTRYGADHVAAVNLRTQLSELRVSIARELKRIAESYKSDYEIAKDRQTQLELDFAKQIAASQNVNRDRLGLYDLESTAHVYHTIYDNFLQHYMEAIQQESFPITEARVISPADPPLEKTSPNGSMVLAIAGAMGLLLSFAVASLREATDRVFRTTKHVEEVLGANCLAILPRLKDVSGTTGKREEKAALSESSDGFGKALSTNNNVARYVVNEPLSAFAEAFRSVKVAADINSVIKENKVIGVTSTIPREGKSTVSCNFAELIAHAGKRAILIDGDLRNPALTRSLAGGSRAGLIEVLTAKCKLANAIYTDEATGLAFLPVVKKSRLMHSNEILASEAFSQLIGQLRKSYDYVIIDLPPLAPIVDVRATVNVIDSYLYVIQWGKTRMQVVRHQLESTPEVYDRLFGVVLNKANLRVLNRYQYYSPKEHYGQYGYTT